MTIEDNPLDTAILRFNMLPSNYIHPSWRPHYFPSTLVEELFSTPRIAHHLSRHILKARHLETTGYFEKTWPHWPLALVTIDQLALYAKVTGGILLRPILQHSIQREAVLHYRQSLGTLYHFILEKGPLLYPKPIEHALSIKEDFLKVSEKWGWISIIKAAKTFPQPIRDRFLLKAPYAMTKIKENIPLSAEQALNLLSRISYEMRS